MQTPTPTPHPSRIARAQPIRPSMYRRLHRWWGVLRTQAQINRAETERCHLQHWMALDQACILAHRLQFTKSLVLQQRVIDDQAELTRLNDRLATLRLTLAEMECGL